MYQFISARETWWRKPLVLIDGRSLPAELAVLHLELQPDEEGAWLNSRGLKTGAVDLVRRVGSVGSGYATSRKPLPPLVTSRLSAVYRESQFSRGCPDLAIWRRAGEGLRLIEVKCPHWDRPSPDQEKFIRGAAERGISTRIVEWEFPSMRHIILNTGQDIGARREEVNDDEVALLKSLLSRAVTGERVAIPGTPLACTITAEDHGGALFAKVWIDTAVLVAIGVAHKLGSEAMWRHLHDVADAEEITHMWSVSDLPPVPWTVTLRFPAAPLYRDVMSWIGDLEVCIAWAWLERTT